MREFLEFITAFQQNRNYKRIDCNSGKQGKDFKSRLEYVMFKLPFQCPSRNLMGLDFRDEAHVEKMNWERSPACSNNQTVLFDKNFWVKYLKGEKQKASDQVSRSSISHHQMKRGKSETEQRN